MQEMNNERRAEMIADGLAEVSLSWREIEDWNPQECALENMDAAIAVIKIVKGEPPEEGFEEQKLRTNGVVGRIISHFLQVANNKFSPFTGLAEELASDQLVKREIVAIRDVEVQEAVLDELARRITEAAEMRDVPEIDQFGWTPDNSKLDFEVMELASALIRERFKRIFKNTLQFGRDDK